MTIVWLQTRPKRPATWLLHLCALALALLPITTHSLTCVVTTSGVAFGGYNFNHPAPTDTTGNIQVSCSSLTSLSVSYNILFSSGGSGSYAPRRMTSGANQLQYNLYTNAGHSAVWGDGTAGTSIVSDGYALGLLSMVRNYPVYGMLPAGQNMLVGAYEDTIMVTLNY